MGAVIASEAGRKIEEKLNKDSMDPRDRKVASLSDISPDELLRLDKKNFQILYEQVERIELKKSSLGVNGPRTGSMSVESREHKKESFDISVGQDYDTCLAIVSSVLADKLK